jgi:hypothetical protein
MKNNEVYAAIAMAIYEATELHDEEKAVLTFKRPLQNYSPWNSKIFTLRKIPQKK